MPSSSTNFICGLGSWFRLRFYYCVKYLMEKCNDLCPVFHIVLLINFVAVILSFWKPHSLAFHFLSSLCFPDSSWICSLGKTLRLRHLLLLHLLAFSTLYPFSQIWLSSFCREYFISYPSCVLPFTSTYLMTSYLKSVPPYPFFYFISIYFA